MASTKDLLAALEPFARVWRINEELTPSTYAGMREYVSRNEPTMGDCKRASDILENFGHEFK